MQTLQVTSPTHYVEHFKHTLFVAILTTHLVAHFYNGIYIILYYYTPDLDDSHYINPTFFSGIMVCRNSFRTTESTVAMSRFLFFLPW